MTYFISRGSEQYGPYSMAQLERYAAEGRIARTDFARAEDSQKWAPVQQLLVGLGGELPALPELGSTQKAGLISRELPPGLHWTLLLLLALVTFGFFTWVWMFVQANFIRKRQPENNSMVFYGIALPLFFIGGGLAAALPPDLRVIATLVEVGGFILVMIGHYRLRDSIDDTFHLQLSGIMTLFFNTIYFQYHLGRERRNLQRAIPRLGAD